MAKGNNNERSGGGRRLFNAGDGAVTAAAAIGLTILLQIMAGAIFARSGISESPYFNLVLMLFIQLIYISVYILFVKKKNKTLLFGADKTALKRLSLPAVLVSVIFPVLMIVCFYGITLLFARLLQLTGYTQAGGVSLDTPGQTAFGLIIMIGFAPIGEELIFRGALLSGLKTKYSAVKSALFSGLIFMLMHMNPDQTVYQFVMGFSAALVVLATGSLYCGVIIHALSNALAAIMDYTALGGVVENAVSWGLQNIAALIVISLLLAAAGVVIIAVLCALLYKNRKNKELAEVKGNAVAADNETSPGGDGNDGAKVGDKEIRVSVGSSAPAVKPVLSESADGMLCQTTPVSPDKDAPETGGAAGKLSGLKRLLRRAKELPDTRDTDENKFASDKIYYFLAVGVCFVMWLVQLISRIVDL